LEKGAIEIKGLLLTLFFIYILSSLNVTLASISPDTLAATLRPGQSISETKTVYIPEVIPKGDIMFSFDVSGSMIDDIDAAKAAASNITDEIDARVADANYGVISYSDYPGYYTSCGYADWYGHPGTPLDYPYQLDHPITHNRTAVIETINALTYKVGRDYPQSYTRIMYETYSDAAIGWRTGAKKIVINFGDDVPHDCNVNEGVPGTTGTWSTGWDPGRDATIGTADDLDLQTTLSEMAAAGVAWLEVHGTGRGFNPHWEYWTSLTGGSAYNLTVVSPEAVAEAVATLVEELATHLDTLTLQTTPGYEAWLTSVTPPSYTNLTLPATVTFDITITVPLGTPPGTYIFKIIAVGDSSNYGEQIITITVPPPPPAVGGLCTPIHVQAINKFELFDPWTGLVLSLILSTAAVSLIYVKHRKKLQP